MPRPPRIEAIGLSDPGRQRPQNEDAFAIHLDLGLLVVADGMGGHSGGEIASRVAVEAVAAHLHEALAFQPAPPSLGSRASALLVGAVERANQAVRTAARRMSCESDMGTTVACVLARGDRAAVAHVGDSRVYRYREHRLETLTEDHSLVAEYVRAGYLTPHLASIFPDRHIVTRSLGAEDSVQVDTRLLEPVAGDLLLLCSDGLSGVLEEEEIGGVLGGVRELEEGARLLIARANAKGGPDNVTVVLARWLA